MGKGDPTLQHKLLKTHLTMLNDNGYLPLSICFYADGVKMVVEGSPVLDELHALADQGVLLIICLTCLKHYDLVDKRAVGIVGGMADIIEAQWKADKVITL
jgi:intracellular sulfur oxidation DsrE/DsrF family protein